MLLNGNMRKFIRLIPKKIIMKRFISLVWLNLKEKQKLLKNQKIKTKKTKFLILKIPKKKLS